MSTNRREGKRMSRCRRCSTSAQLETLPQQKTNARRFDDVCPVDIFRFFRVEHSPETNEFVGIVATTMKKERVDRWGVPKIWDSLAGRRGHRQSNKPHFFGAEPNARARSRIEVFWVPFLTENVQRTASFVWSVTSGLRNTVRRHITQKTPQQYDPLEGPCTLFSRYFRWRLTYISLPRNGTNQQAKSFQSTTITALEPIVSTRGI